MAGTPWVEKKSKCWSSGLHPGVALEWGRIDPLCLRARKCRTQSSGCSELVIYPVSRLGQTDVLVSTLSKE